MRAEILRVGPSSGLWQMFRPIFELAQVGTAVLAALGKGKGRLLLLGCALADAIVVLRVILLNLD